MELLLITSTKLKIVMSNEDMVRYEINCDRLDYTDCEAKRAIRNILDEAKHKVGFDTKGKQVFIQIFPSKDGGCEMYVTKTHSGEDPQLPVPMHTEGKEVPSVYRFQTTASLLGGCHKLRMQNRIIASSAFVARSGSECYLLVYTAEKDILGRDPMFLSVIHEYGNLVKGNYALAYLHEHCDCICQENAISTLAALC